MVRFVCELRNYRSFFTEQTIKFNFDDKHVNAVLGPNGSGKTNLFAAVAFFRDFIRTSTQFTGQRMAYESFLLNVQAGDQPTTFAAELEIEHYIYKYSFSLFKAEVVDERLTRKQSGKSAITLFSRNSLDKNRYATHGFSSELARTTRPDALVLTKAWENNNKHAKKIFVWLDHLMLMSNSQPITKTAEKIIESAQFKDKVLALLQAADLHIQDIDVTQVKMPDEVFAKIPLKDELKAQLNRVGYSIATTHFIRNQQGKIIKTRPLSLESHESLGTKRIFELAYPLLDTLEQGNVLYIDEFEILLHPKECLLIVSLFKASNNPKQAQLIINTHNTQVLDQIGRNNIHLLGKNQLEATVIGKIPAGGDGDWQNSS